MKNFKKQVIISLLLFMSQCSLLQPKQTWEPKVLVWDLGGVLLESSKWPYVNGIGIPNILSYILLDWKLPNLKPQLFEILRSLETIEEKDLFRAPLADGTSMPLLISKWQSGNLKGHEAIDKALEKLNELYNKREIKSIRQKILLEQMIKTMFCSKTLAQSIYPLIEGIALFQECALQKDENGKPRYTMAILSNWDKDSFPIIYSRFPEIFTHVDTRFIFISGEMGYHKPQEESFHRVLSVMNVHPEECIFIDDQLVNVDAAKKLGIKGIQLEKGNFKKLRSELIKEQIIKN